MNIKIYEQNRGLFTFMKTVQMTTVEVPVKPYVKAYLEKNYGNPVNLSSVRGLNNFFKLLLEKNYYRNDKQINLNGYTTTVNIVITRDVFYRHGWYLSKTSVVSFNGMVESLVKNRIRDMVYVNVIHGGKKIAKSIRLALHELSINEDDLSFDAVKKDIQRNTCIKVQKKLA